MIKTCERCGCKYETCRPNRLFCPVCNDAAQLERRREKNRLRHKQEREQMKALRQQKADKSVGKPTKTLAEWMHEAAECNLDYGTYRTLVEFQGKTFDELRAQNQNRSATYHARGHHRSKNND